MQLDWQRYRDFFPTKYFENGQFDQIILNIVQKNKPVQILDIGGGAYGTEILKNEKKNQQMEITILDPYVKKPDWYDLQSDWNTKNKFDLIICRGALNYLNQEQLEKIPMMLNKNGEFVANSFSKIPAPSIKDVVNNQGDKGLETVNIRGNIIDHTICFPKYTITHEIMYHSLHDLFNYWTVFQYIIYNKNSVYYHIKNF